MDDKLLEAVKSYNSFYKDKHNSNAENYFDDLTKKSNVDINANRETIKKRNEIIKKANELKDKVKGKRALKAFLITLMIAIPVIGIVLILIGSTYENSALIISGISMVCVGVVLDIVLGILIVKKLNPIIKELDQNIAKLLREVEDLKILALKQMAPLNALFDWNIPSSLFTKTVPEIVMDKEFDPKKYQHLHEKYGFKENADVNRSTIALQSGSIYGNPFLFCTDLVTKLVPHTYTGTKVITWTTSERINGKTVTHHHSQTLVAEVVKDKPIYFGNTYLVYGNDAAKDLTFTRNGCRKYKGEDEDKREKIVKRNEDDLQRYERKQTKEGDDFTLLGNDEFETFFGGLDRDHEVQFRLLFTPFAQKNMLDLIYNDPYGDDFDFNKYKGLNFIISKHSQKGYNTDPANFEGYDYDFMRKNFIDYNNNFFKGIYFDLAPLTSIPLYLQNKAEEYIYQKEYRSNITSFEHEVIANSYDDGVFKHPKSKTQAILKSTYVKKDNGADIVDIKAFSYDMKERVSYIEKYGNDGRYHSVPVTWYEYIPLEKERQLLVTHAYNSKMSFANNMVNDFEKFNSIFNLKSIKYQRGMISSLINDSLLNEDVNKLLEKLRKGE